MTRYTTSKTDSLWYCIRRGVLYNQIQAVCNTVCLYTARGLSMFATRRWHYKSEHVQRDENWINLPYFYCLPRGFSFQESSWQTMTTSRTARPTKRLEKSLSSDCSTPTPTQGAKRHYLKSQIWSKNLLKRGFLWMTERRKYMQKLNLENVWFWRQSARLRSWLAFLLLCPSLNKELKLQTRWSLSFGTIFSIHHWAMWVVILSMRSSTLMSRATSARRGLRTSPSRPQTAMWSYVKIHHAGQMACISTECLMGVSTMFSSLI